MASRRPSSLAIAAGASPNDTGSMTRTADELANVTDPLWPDILQAVDAREDGRFIPLPRARGMQVLEALQVTARSPLGALALNAGGLVVDHGWFRIFGGGGEGLPDLASVNALPASGPPSSLLVAQDVLGGQFAIDGGGLGLNPGAVCYLGPDTLTWGDLGIGYGQFVFSAIEGDLAEAFADLRWPGWEQEVETLAPSQGITLYPPPFSEEGRDKGKAYRRPVPMEELVRFYADAAEQLNGRTGRS